MADSLTAVAELTALIKLEPLLSNAIVLNLAYLALPKFAYIDELRTMISDRLSRLDLNVVNSVRDTVWFNQAKALTQVRTFERVDAPSQPRWLNLPGVWGLLYNVLFYWRIGRAIAVLVTALSLFMLVIAIGDENGAIHWFQRGFPQTTVYFDFWLSLFALLWPILVVMAGTHVSYQAASFVNYQTKNLKSSAEAEVARSVDEFGAWWEGLKKP